MKTSDVPSVPNFEIGARYFRKELHDTFGGQRQHGISTPSDESFLFLFTDPTVEELGYHDQFLSNGLFIYSGEGRFGDMTMDKGNERIRHHQTNGDSLHVFEVVGEENGADVVTYDGEYEYVDHFWEQARDLSGRMREAVRFKLEPVGGITSEISDEELGKLSDEELFHRAKESGTSGQSPPTSTSGSARNKVTRSQVVREFAQRMADGICQACGNHAPFLGEDGQPFLEVHHLYRVSDGGVDEPENVIAICPNCHREIHYGQNGDEVNQRLIEQAAERNEVLY